MKLPICRFDLESDLLCPSCQGKYDRGEITDFDIEFCKWLLEIEKQYPLMKNLNLVRAVMVGNRLILVVKKSKQLLESDEELLNEMTERFGNVMIMDGPAKLRKVVRTLIYPAVEVGVNSLYLPNGFKESIVMLRSEDRERIQYSKDELRGIASAVVGELVLFQYQDESVEKSQEKQDDSSFDEKMSDFMRRGR